RELHDAEVLTPGDVGIEPPAQCAVEAHGAIDVCNGKDDHLELHVDRAGSRGPDRGFAAHYDCSHGFISGLSVRHRRRDFRGVCSRLWPQPSLVPVAVGQYLSTSITAWANACGASWGRLCPMPPVTSRCAYRPENLLA